MCNECTLNPKTPRLLAVEINQFQNIVVGKKIEESSNAKKMVINRIEKKRVEVVGDVVPLLLVDQTLPLTDSQGQMMRIQLSQVELKPLSSQGRGEEPHPTRVNSVNAKYYGSRPDGDPGSAQ